MARKTRPPATADTVIKLLDASTSASQLADELVIAGVTGEHVKTAATQLREAWKFEAADDLMFAAQQIDGVQPPITEELPLAPGKRGGMDEPKRATLVLNSKSAGIINILAAGLIRAQDNDGRLMLKFDNPIRDWDRVWARRRVELRFGTEGAIVGIVKGRLKELHRTHAFIRVVKGDRGMLYYCIDKDR